jgi:uncharacterized protein with LGFP repeats
LLGFPTTDEAFTPGYTGAFQNFSGSGGSSLYWSPSTGAFEVQADIRAHWVALGGSASVLGFPVTDQSAAAVPLTRVSIFQYGEILWRPYIGAHEVNGAIWQLWIRLGRERSRLGLPTSDEFSVAAGRQSNFQHGHIVWNARTGVATAVYS